MADLSVLVGSVKRQAYYIEAGLCQGIEGLAIRRCGNDPEVFCLPGKGRRSSRN